MASVSRVRLLILGTGGMATSHARLFGDDPRVDVVAACDVDAARAEAFATTHGIAKSFGGPDAALAWGKFDAVSNVTPDAVHHPTTMKVIAAGKHVLCEKPLAETFALADEMATAADKAGLAVKINAVALKGVNEDEIEDLLRFSHGRGYDLTLIETMPLGDIDGDRTEQYLPLSIVRARLMERFTLEDIPYRTGGPARYAAVKETGGRLGFITPMTHNFCESCNRVRLTCTGTLYMCLGQDDAADLRTPLRTSSDDTALYAAIDEAIGRKPKGHDFIIDRRTRKPAVQRHMSLTGG